MKRLLVLLLTIFALNSCEQDDTIIDATAEKSMEKVWTYIPDNDFEQQLIWKGLDDVNDNKVLTSNIDTVTVFGISYDSNLFISDLTGLEDFKALESLFIGGYINVMVDFSKLKKLKHLSVKELFQTTTLDLTENKKLTSLKIVEWDDLQSIDLSQNKKLESIWIEFMRNNFELDLTHNKALTKIYFELVDGLTSIDLSENKNLQEVYIEHCGFTTLDLSNNHVLSDITIRSFDVLTSLNVQNGNNLFFTNFDVSVQQADPSLFECFQVDDAEWSTANWSTDYIYSEDCY